MNELAVWAGHGLTAAAIGVEPLALDDRRASAESVPSARSPCRDCQHASRCAAESLACCAYSAYVESAGYKRRARHRTPSAAWFAFSGAGRRPHCPDCALGRHPRDGTWARLQRALREHPGANTAVLSRAIGVSIGAAGESLRRMERQGAAIAIGTERNARNGKPMKLWKAAGYEEARP